MKYLLLTLLVTISAIPIFGQGAPPITFQEQDGSPKKTSPSKIIVSNGSLTCSGSTCTITTGGGSSSFTDPVTITETDVNCFAVGPNGTTNPVFQIVCSIASQATGLSVTGRAAGAGVDLTALSSGTDENIKIAPKGAGYLESTGALRLSGTGSDTFTTPGAAGVPTKINVPLYDPGAFGQIVAMGIGNINANRRVMSLFDARTVAHQPTLSVFSPNENEVAGLSWDGSNTEVTFKTSPANGTIRFTDGTSTAQVLIAPAATGAGAAFLHVVSAAAAGLPLRVDTAASPSAAIADFTNNGTSRVTIQNNSQVLFSGVTFANLGTPANGTMSYCTDCDAVGAGAATATCAAAGGGTGAMAFRINGAWKCL